jgi:hypothetical protein
VVQPLLAVELPDQAVDGGAECLATPIDTFNYSSLKIKINLGAAKREAASGVEAQRRAESLILTQEAGQRVNHLNREYAHQRGRAASRRHDNERALVQHQPVETGANDDARRTCRCRPGRS